MTFRSSAVLASSMLLILGLTACGSDEAPPPKAAGEKSSAAPAADETSGDFCSGADELTDRFALLDISIGTDWATTVPELGEANAELEAASPPDEIADDWATVTAFYGLVSAAFDGVDLKDEDAIGVVLAETLGPKTEAKAKAAQAAADRIESHVASECGSEEGASDQGAAGLTDACTLLTAADLKRTFAGDAPKGKSRSYGGGNVECIWEGDKAEVSVMIMPIDDFTQEFLDKSTPLPTSEISGMGDSQAYKGVVGIGRFSTRGHSVSFTTDDVGGFMSVRQGETSSRPVEVGDATRLAKVVFAQL